MGQCISKVYGGDMYQVDPEKFSEIIDENDAASIICPKDDRRVTSTVGILWVLRSSIHAFLVFEHLHQTDDAKHARVLEYFDFGPQDSLAMLFGGTGKGKCENRDGEENKRFQKLEIGPSWGNRPVHETSQILLRIFSDDARTGKYSSFEINSSSGNRKLKAKNCLSFIEKEVLRNEELNLPNVDEIVKSVRWRLFPFPPAHLRKMKNAQDNSNLATINEEKSSL